MCVMKDFKSRNDDIIQQIIDSGNYTITRDGKVLSNITGEEIGYTDDRGYRRITFSRKKIQVHRLVWAVYGDKKLTPKLVINHKNGNKIDNSIDNLELVTQSDNIKHRFRVLKYPAVKGHKKIDDSIAEQIRSLRKSGWKYSELCKKFKLCKSSISYIINKKTWN